MPKETFVSKFRGCIEGSRAGSSDARKTPYQLRWWKVSAAGIGRCLGGGLLCGSVWCWIVRWVCAPDFLGHATSIMANAMEIPVKNPARRPPQFRPGALVRPSKIDSILRYLAKILRPARARSQHERHQASSTSTMGSARQPTPAAARRVPSTLMA